MTNTTHLALPLLEAAQAQKHVTHNESIAMLDALTHLSVAARNVNAPPSSPVEGDRVLVGASPTGAFTGKSGQVAVFLAGGWTFFSPRAGWRAYVAAETLLLVYDGAAWIDLGLTLDELQNLTRLGVGATADAANPFAAKINAALFTAKTVAEGGSGDLRVALNKESASKTASQIYQSNFSGRAETGLTGDDNFRVKVSADGSTWRDGIVVDRTTGSVSFPSGGPTRILTFATSGTYAPTPGMRFAEVILFGGGGGGGSGARTAAGAAASGGAAGGGGGRAIGRFTADQIGASRPITVGAGGAGGAPRTTNSSAGNPGSAGGNTSLGALLVAFGGGAGAGGQIGAGSGGGGGSSQLTAGASGSGASGGLGSGGVGNGGSGAAGSAATLPGFGSGGAGSPASGGAGLAGGNGYFTSAGGGSGGGLTSANVASNGGAGGALWVGGVVAIAPGGVTSETRNGGVGSSWLPSIGSLDQSGAGGGGGASDLTAPGAGGAGGFPSGGGGGGGASQNGASSGAGGAGGAGYAIIIEYF
jgi:hypothetical protein